MKITTKGQVTIPIEFREQLGLYPNCEVDFEIVGNILQIKKTKKKDSTHRGNKIINQMKGKATVSMSTEEIMRLTRK